VSEPVTHGEHVAVPGFESIEVEGALLVARPEALAWSRQALGRHGSLHAAASGDATLQLQGRGTIPVMLNPGGEGPAWAVRHYKRGGGMRFLNDRFLRLGTPRCLRELECSVRVRELGTTTPRVVAAAVYTSGLFYRADLVTEFVYDARELADILLGSAAAAVPPSDPDMRVLALTCIDRLLIRMVKRGIRHPDLNARNILLAQTSQGLEAILLDLDRCVVGGPPSPGDGNRLRQRLARSVRKLQRTRSGDLSDEEMEIILKGHGEP
jgi:3-deoxy-D-manno-octulosonic acid kinase